MRKGRHHPAHLVRVGPKPAHALPILLASAVFVFTLITAFSNIVVAPRAVNAAGSTVIFLTSGSSWTVPSDWNNSANTIECIGGGGGGGRFNQASGLWGGGGGGGGGYAAISNQTYTSGASITYTIGSAGSGAATSGASGGNGGDTSILLNDNVTIGCLAKGGVGGGAGPGSAGGSVASETGTTKFSGGAGGSGNVGTNYGAGGGGGGAGGPNGNGQNGGSNASGNWGAGGGGGANNGSVGANGSGVTGGVGGNGRGGTGGGSAGGGNATSGTGGGGGGGNGGSTIPATSPTNGGNGAQDTISGWVQTSNGATAGPSGGGGGGGSFLSSAGVGGSSVGYGGGGGGGGGASASGNGGSGAPGIIVITYTPLTPVPGTPGTPTFTSVTTSSMRVNWTAASGATSYKVERCSGTSCATFAQITAGDTNLYYDDTGLSAGTSYSYRVRGTNAAGDGAYSGTGTQSTGSTSGYGDAGAGTPLTGYAWSDLVGWISMNCSNTGTCATSPYAVKIDSGGNLFGHAWSDSLGWIQFGNLSSYPAGSGTTAGNGAFTGGALTGWARACEGTAPGDCSTMTTRTDGWDGWIALSGTGYGPSLSSGKLVGYSWGGEAIGWISWSGTGYEVDTTYQPCAATQGYMCLDSNTSQHTAADCAVTTQTCSAQGTGWFCSASNGLCTAPPAPSFGTNADGSSGIINAKPSLVRQGSATKIIWTVNNATSCAVTGTNGDTWSGTASLAGGNTTKSLTQKTTYSIHCTGSGGTLDGTKDVNIIPEWQEK